MARVTGIGGIFFKARDPRQLANWYAQHLGVPVTEYGAAVFPRDDPADEGRESYAVWALFPPDSEYFAPSAAAFMVNFRVDDLDALLAQLRQAGVAVDERIDESEYGRFGWVMDPEGNRVELWEPRASSASKPD